MAQVDGFVQQNVFIPSSSIVSSRDLGISAHTNYVFRIAPAVDAAVAGETPETIRSVYRISDQGGKAAIAIVDAYHDPNATAEFNTFSSRFRTT